ncbi:MAG TPA: hypothetical protein VFR38_15255, partial [Gaiellaceae bacterium]|nr:hypothetical protein [Gaiellaceae bacterium]
MTATLAELDELYAAVEETRRRALELSSLLERLPGEREAAAREADEAGRGLARARTSLEEAEEALRTAEASGKDELLAEARRAVVRARDRLTMAGRRDEEARSRLEEVE